MHWGRRPPAPGSYRRSCEGDPQVLEAAWFDGAANIPARREADGAGAGRVRQLADDEEEE